MKENETRNLLMQEFCKNFKDDYIKESFENEISEPEEIQKYRAIGTVEECREAVEKQNAKKPELDVAKKRHIISVIVDTSL